MNASRRWRRVAAKLARHAAAVLPGASPWVHAMRRELDYIEDDRTALAWALGCVLASYKARLAVRTKIGLDRLKHPRTREVLRHAAVGVALMLAVGLALLENGRGQAAPASSPPVLDETACDKADKGPDLDRNPAYTLPSGAVAARPTLQTSCAGRNAPVRVLPIYDAP